MESLVTSVTDASTQPTKQTAIMDERHHSRRFSTSVRSFYDSLKEHVIIHAKHYSYYISVLSLIVLLFVLYCNYSLFSTGGFFWIIVELMLALFTAWQHSMMYLKL